MMAICKLITEKQISLQEVAAKIITNFPRQNINPKNYHYRFRLDLQYFPRYLECVVLVNLY